MLCTPVATLELTEKSSLKFWVVSGAVQDAKSYTLTCAGAATWLHENQCWYISYREQIGSLRHVCGTSCCNNPAAHSICTAVARSGYAFWDMYSLRRLVQARPHASRKKHPRMR